MMKLKTYICILTAAVPLILTGMETDRSAVPGLLFYASFDKAELEVLQMDQWPAHVRSGMPGVYPRVDMALGRATPLNVQRVEPMPGVFGQAVRVPPGAMLAFDALGNIQARRGTLAVWVSALHPLFSAPYRGGSHPQLLLVADVQSAGRSNPFLRMSVVGPRSELRFFDWRWRPPAEWQPGEWHHIALTWDAAGEQVFYHNGEAVLRRNVSEFRHPALDQINLNSQAHPAYASGAVDIGMAYDELHIFDYDLTPEQIRRLMDNNEPPAQRNPSSPDRPANRVAWVREHYALDDARMPVLPAEGLRVRRVQVERTRSSYTRERFTSIVDTRRGMDGKWHTATGADTQWFAFYGTEQFNYIRMRGPITGQFRDSSGVFASFQDETAVRRMDINPARSASEVWLERESGTLRQLDFYEINALEQGYSLPDAQVLYLHPNACEGESEACFRVNAYYPAEDRTVLAGRPTPATKSYNVDIEPGRLYHFISEPFTEDRAVNRILLDIPMEGFAQGGALVAKLHCPVTFTRLLLEFDAIIPPGPDSRTVRLLVEDLDLLYAAGRQIWISVFFDGTGRIKCGGTAGMSLRFDGDLTAHGERDIRAQERILSDLFLSLSQPQQWNARGGHPPEQFKGIGELFALAGNILHFDPDNRTAGAILSWTLRRRGGWDPAAAELYSDPLEDFSIEEPQTNGPDWAVYGRAALKASRAYVDWWINERQDPATGQMGGGVSDDTTLAPGFVNFALIGDPDNRLREAVRLLADYTWHNLLYKGLAFARDGKLLPGRVRDHLHTYEEGTNVQHLMLRLYYGYPEYIERMMITSTWYADHLTGINPQGKRLMRSANFSAGIASPPPGHARHEPYDSGMAMILHPGRALTWYNHSPEVMRVLLEWMDAWLYYAPGREDESLRRDYFGVGAIEFETGKRRGRATPNNDLWYHLFWAYDITRDERYREPVLRMGRVGRPVPAWHEWHAMAPDEESVKAIRQRYGDADRYEYLEFQMGGAPDSFLEGIKRGLLDAAKYMPVHTRVGQSTDRVNIPLQNELGRMYLGGVASRAKRLPYHFHAVSWEGADDDVARFVVSKGLDHLRVLIYSFHDEPRDIRMRVWQLDPGRYRIRTGIDPAGNDAGRQLLDTREQALWRYEGVELNVPSRQVLVVEIDRIEAFDWQVQDNPDLAVGPGDVRISNRDIEVTVHNIGRYDAPPTTVRLLRGNDILAEQSLPAIEAPNDLVPRTAKVVFKDIADGDVSGLRIVVDPENIVREITTVNNVIRVGE